MPCSAATCRGCNRGACDNDPSATPVSGARRKAFAAERGHTLGEFAVAWLLAHPVVCSVIAGAAGPDQLTANAKATEWTLTPDEVAPV